MKVAVDTHTHTLASGHAYNTIREMAAMAAHKGLEALSITDHAPLLPGGTHLYYFENHGVIPRELSGVRILFGAELSIMGEDGEVDLPGRLMNTLDITVASIHKEVYGKSKGLEKNTQAYVNAMENEHIDIIGHPDDGRYEADYETIVEAAVRTGTLLEVNNSSLRPNSFRQNAFENDLKMLRLCKKMGAMVVLGSDAHMDVDIANTLYSSKVLEEADFPEKLIANTSYERLQRVLKRNQA